MYWLFSTNFVWNISDSKNWPRYYRTCSAVFTRSARYSCQSLMKLEFSRQIFEISSNIKFHENRSSGSPERHSGRPQEFYFLLFLFIFIYFCFLFLYFLSFLGGFVFIYFLTLGRPQATNSRFSHSVSTPNKGPKLAESYALHFFWRLIFGYSSRLVRLEFKFGF